MISPAAYYRERLDKRILRQLCSAAAHDREIWLHTRGDDGYRAHHDAVRRTLILLGVCAPRTDVSANERRDYRRLAKEGEQRRKSYYAALRRDRLNPPAAGVSPLAGPTLVAIYDLLGYDLGPENDLEAMYEVLEAWVRKGEALGWDGEAYRRVYSHPGPVQETTSPWRVRDDNQ